jgi:hypothetical protein
MLGTTFITPVSPWSPRDGRRRSTSGLKWITTGSLDFAENVRAVHIDNLPASRHREGTKLLKGTPHQTVPRKRGENTIVAAEPGRCRLNGDKLTAA